MAGELKYTGNTDFFIAAALNQLLHPNVVDRTDLRKTVTNFGSVVGTGSLASQIATVTFDDAMAAANTDEVTAVSNTDVGHGNVTITVARQALMRTVTDVYSLVGGPRPGIQALAADMGNAAALRFTDIVAALFSSFSAGGGTSGSPLSVDDVMDGHFALIRAQVPGSPNCVLAPTPLTHFLDSLRGEGGSAEFNPATEQMLSSSGGDGYGVHGSWRGITFWSCDSVPTSGGDRIGAIYVPGAIGYMEAIPGDILAQMGPGSYAALAPNGSPIYVEFERKSAEGHTLITGNYFVGASVVEAARGRKLTSSAT